MRWPLRRRRHLLALTVAELSLPPPPPRQCENALDRPSTHVADRPSGLSDYATSKAQDDAEVRADDAQRLTAESYLSSTSSGAALDFLLKRAQLVLDRAIGKLVEAVDVHGIGRYRYE